MMCWASSDPMQSTSDPDPQAQLNGDVESAEVGSGEKIS